jgi:guanylate kinase
MTALFIISAPSGSGKSTLVNCVRRLVQGLDFSISYTTREPRGEEQHGREYYFVTRQEFETMIAHDEFLEYANVFGNYYGTAKRFLQQAQAQGHDLLLDIDVQGAAQIQRKIPDAVSVFILPPDRNKLEERLRHRGQDAEQVIQKRLLTATREIENYQKYDYILVNDRLEDSVESLKAILLVERATRHGELAAEGDMTRAERCRLSNVKERVKPILSSFTPVTAPSAS